MARHLHLDPFGGIAPAQWLGLLLDLRASADSLEAAVQAAQLHAKVEEAEREVGGIKSFEAKVVTADRSPRDPAWARSSLGGLPDDRSRSRALAVVDRLAEATEGEIPDGVASVAAIAGACALLEDLKVETLSCGPIATGSGFARGDAEMVPIPSPAAARLLEGFETYPGEEKVDLVPVAGAALVAALCEPVRIHPGLVLDRYGHGAGEGGTVNTPNVLRGYIGDQLSPLVQLEATAADPPEQIAYAVERLHQVGALEAWVESASMNRGRMGARIVAIGQRKDEADIRTVLLRETSAISVRGSIVEVTQAFHRTQRVSTAFGEVPVRRKADWLTPDYESCAALAREHGVPIHRVLDAARVAARRADPRAAPGGGPGAPAGAPATSPPPS